MAKKGVENDSDQSLDEKESDEIVPDPKEVSDEGDESENDESKNSEAAKKPLKKGPVNTLDSKGNPSEENPKKQMEEKSAKEEILELKLEIKTLNDRIVELSKKPDLKSKTEVKKLESKVELKENKVDWIMDQYNF